MIAVWVQRLLIGHWPLILVPFFLINAALAEPPYETAMRVMWLLTAAVMFFASFRQARDPHLIAMCVGLFSAVARAYVLVTDSGRTEQSAWRAACVWLLVAVLIVTVTVAVEIGRAKTKAEQKVADRAEKLVGVRS